MNTNTADNRTHLENLFSQAYNLVPSSEDLKLGLDNALIGTKYVAGGLSVYLLGRKVLQFSTAIGCKRAGQMFDYINRKEVSDNLKDIGLNKLGKLCAYPNKHNWSQRLDERANKSFHAAKKNLGSDIKTAAIYGAIAATAYLAYDFQNLVYGPVVPPTV